MRPDSFPDSSLGLPAPLFFALFFNFIFTLPQNYTILLSGKDFTGILLHSACRFLYEQKSRGGLSRSALKG